MQLHKLRSLRRSFLHFQYLFSSPVTNVKMIMMMMMMIWPDYQEDHDLWFPLLLAAKKKTLI